MIAAVERRGELKMPPEGEPLSHDQIAMLKALDRRRGELRRRGGSKGRALGIPEADASARTGSRRSRLGGQSDRCLHRRQARRAEADAGRRSAAESAPAAGVSRSDRLAADARRAAGFGVDAIAIRNAYAMSVDRLLDSPAVWRALGPALDGCLAV